MPPIYNSFFFWVWELFIYGLNTHKQSVRRCPKTHAKGVLDLRRPHRPLSITTTAPRVSHLDTSLAV